MPMVDTADLKIVKLELNDTDPVSRTEMLREIDILERKFDSRLAEKEKAIVLLQTYADRQPSIAEVATSVDSTRSLIFERIDGKIGTVSAMMDGNRKATDSKFEGVEKQFSELDVRTERNAALAKEAVAAALQAQKESVGAQNISIAASNEKMETSFTKQIDQQATLISSVGKTSDDKVDDLKDRLQSLDNRIQAIESRKEGSTETRQGNNSNLSLVIAGIGIVAGIAIAVVSHIR
jgi:hypothetical protein